MCGVTVLLCVCVVLQYCSVYVWCYSIVLCVCVVLQYCSVYVWCYSSALY